MHGNNKTLKDQNSRLMTVNEKLLAEGEELRKEIYRLRLLFGQESLLTGNQHPERGGISSILSPADISSDLKRQIEQLQQEVKNVSQERDRAISKLRDLQDDLAGLRAENISLKDSLKITSSSASLKQTVQDLASTKAELFKITSKCNQVEEALAIERNKFSSKNKELLDVINQLDNYKRKHQDDIDEKNELKTKLENVMNSIKEDKKGSDIKSKTNEMQTGRGSFIQGTSTQRGSVMIDPAEIEKLRRDLQDVVLENDKLKMDLSQQEKEKDLAKKRQSEAEADTAAQIEKVKYLEKVMAEQQAKLRQAPRPSTVGGSRFVSIDDLNNAQDKLHDSEKELAHIRNELIDLKGEYARIMREKEQADGRAREAQQAADQSAKEAKYFKEKSETLQQELYAEQPGQPGQPGQQPRGSTLGGKQTFETQTSRVFDPSGGRGSFIQGTSTQRGSVMIDPAEIEKLRRDLQDVVLENDKLKMDLSQQEKEKDLAKKRQSEAEADTAAQIEKVKYLEKVMAEQQAKLRQAPRPSTVGGSRFVSIDDLNNAQDKLHDSEKELAHIRNELIDLKGEYAKGNEREGTGGRAS
jgi:chromosome segregation ATPase